MTREQLKQLETDLWSAADNLRANSDLKSSEYATPVLGLIFLKFADNNYRRHEADIIAEFQKLKGSRREKKISDIAIEKCGFYLPDHERYDYLLNLPEEKDIAKGLKAAMKAVEEYKPELEGVLPKDDYFRLTRDAGGTAQGSQKCRNLLPAHPLAPGTVPQGGIRGRDRPLQTRQPGGGGGAGVFAESRPLRRRRD